MRNSWLLAIFTIGVTACVATESPTATSTEHESESQSELAQSVSPQPQFQACAAGTTCVQSDECPTVDVAKCGLHSCCLSGTTPPPPALVPVAATATAGTAGPSSTR